MKDFLLKLAKLLEYEIDPDVRGWVDVFDSIGMVQDIQCH